MIYNLPRRVELQLQMVLEEDPIPIQTRRPDIPEDLAALIHRGLARKPKDRFPDVKAMRKALVKFR